MPSWKAQSSQATNHVHGLWCHASPPLASWRWKLVCAARVKESNTMWHWDARLDAALTRLHMRDKAHWIHQYTTDPSAGSQGLHNGRQQMEALTTTPSILSPHEASMPRTETLAHSYWLRYATTPCTDLTDTASSSSNDTAKVTPLGETTPVTFYGDAS